MAVLLFPKWAYYLNLLLLQFLFVRLTMHSQNQITVGWSLQGFIIPLTGWNTRFIYISKKPVFIYFWKNFDV